jgi:thiopeptide-type bacteriocin biosynthesis protein
MVRILHGEPARLREFLAPCAEDLSRRFETHRLADLQIVPYEPELTRYGESTLAICERIFQLDSEYVLQTMSAARDHANPDELRYDLALIAMDVYARASRLPLRELRDRLRLNRDFRARTVGVGKAAVQGIGTRYRHAQARIAQILDPERAGDSPILVENPWLANFTRDCRALMNELGPQAERSWLDLVHMHCNRMFTAGRIQYEAVLCDFLSRYYDTRAARDLARERREQAAQQLHV